LKDDDYEVHDVTEKMFYDNDGVVFEGVKYTDYKEFVKSFPVKLPVVGEYCRVSFPKRKLSSSEDVKNYLLEKGWIPSQYNWKTDEETGQRIQMSPKIIDIDLELLGPEGKLYKAYKMLVSRFGVVRGWLEHVDEEGNLHGSIKVIGTPSMRARHSIIANVPTPLKPYGKRMREIFICEDGWDIVGSDSSGNQARGMAFYLDNEEYTDVILNKDIHVYNAANMTKALKQMEIIRVIKRGESKRIGYAYTFGASGGKLWAYIFDVPDGEKGNQFKKLYTAAVPNFEEFVEYLNNTWRNNKRKTKGYGYIISLSGNRVYAEKRHTLLVYLLQAAEAITCSAALARTVDILEERGIEYRPLIMYHDEFQLMVREKDSKIVAEIAAESFREAPKEFGIEIMDGASNIGKTWYETH
jgi:hypothetical protein